MFADMHIHSACSSDAEGTMAELAEDATRAGLNCLCFTDHCDIEHFDTGAYDPDCFNREMLECAFADALGRHGGKPELLLGIELGAANHVPEKAREVSGADCLDFIIGSVHNPRGMADYCTLDYQVEEQRDRIIEGYVTELEELAAQGGFDVVGHIGYPLRFTGNINADILFDRYSERFSKLFAVLIEKGIGIELNTGGLRTALKSALPSDKLLVLYKQCGGEIITLGSDSHRFYSIGSGIKDAQKRLSEMGFKYQTVFRKRKPEFVRL